MIFRTDKDFINGMNDVAVCALLRPVKLYCFCLMSNHVHFVMKGHYETCNGFIRLLKRKISSRITAFSGDTAIIRIDSQDYMKKVIAYVLRNPMAAQANLTPWNYRWSSSVRTFPSQRSMLTAAYRHPECPSGKSVPSLGRGRHFRMNMNCLPTG